MKKILIFLSILVLISCNKRENIKAKLLEKTKIDSLLNEKEIKQFLVEIDSNYKDFMIMMPNEYKSKYSKENFKKIADSLGIKSSFIKEDLDNNGYTDLLISGAYYHNLFVLTILSQGSNKFKIEPLTLEWFSHCIYPKINYIDNLPIIELYKRRASYPDTLSIIDKKNLTYKFGAFIEYNNKVEDTEIIKIEFNREGCYGTCPVFELTLNKNEPSIFRAKYYNFNNNREIVYGKEEGIFKTNINPKDFDEIVDILNYIDFRNLENSYTIYSTDHASATLKITYNNGEVKKIDDYGLVGTYGLKLIYEKISALRFNQKWKK